MEEVKFEMTSADASSGVALTIYVAGGNAATWEGTGVVGASQRLVIRDFTMVNAAAGTYFLCEGSAVANAAGKRIRGGTFGANSGLNVSGIMHYCFKGATPKLFAGQSGQVNVQGSGWIVKE